MNKNYRRRIHNATLFSPLRTLLQPPDSVILLTPFWYSGTGHSSAELESPEDRAGLLRFLSMDANDDASEVL